MRTGFERPVIIHRAILGSLERMIAIVTEQFVGKWPFWISPKQACVIPVSEKHFEFANKIKNRLVHEGFSVEIDEDNATLSKKIRNAQVNRFNYIAVVGDKEIESQTVSLRERELNKNLGTFTVTQMIELFNSLMPRKSKAQLDFEVKII